MKKLILMAMLVCAGCINSAQGEKELQQTGEAAALWMILVQNGGR